MQTPLTPDNQLITKQIVQPTLILEESVDVFEIAFADLLLEDTENENLPILDWATEVEDEIPHTAADTDMPDTIDFPPMIPTQSPPQQNLVEEGKVERTSAPSGSVETAFALNVQLKQVVEEARPSKTITADNIEIPMAKSLPNIPEVAAVPVSNPVSPQPQSTNMPTATADTFIIRKPDGYPPTVPLVEIPTGTRSKSEASEVAPIQAQAVPAVVNRDSQSKLQNNPILSNAATPPPMLRPFRPPAPDPDLRQDPVRREPQRVAEPPAINAQPTLVLGDSKAIGEPFNKEVVAQSLDMDRFEGVSLRNVDHAQKQQQFTPLSTAPQIAKAVAHQMAVAVSQTGAGVTELALSPEELGRVRLVVSTHEGAISVLVMADRPETNDLMRRHIESLTEEFRNLGFSTTNFQFSDGDSDTQKPDNQGGTEQADAHLVDDDGLIAGSPSLAVTTGLDLRL